MLKVDNSNGNFHQVNIWLINVAIACQFVYRMKRYLLKKLLLKLKKIKKYFYPHNSWENLSMSLLSGENLMLFPVKLVPSLIGMVRQDNRKAQMGRGITCHQNFFMIELHLSRFTEVPLSNCLIE